MSEKESGGIKGFSVGFGKEGDPGNALEVAERGPLRIVVLAELTSPEEYSTGPAPHLDALPIDKQTFDAVMEKLAPTLAIDVADPFDVKGAPIGVDLRFRELRDLRPDSVADQIPLLRALVSAKRIVDDVRARKTSAADARAQLARVLPRPAWAEALTSEVVEAHAPEKAASGSSAAAAPAPAQAKGGSLDDLLAMVDISPPPESSAAPASEAPAGDHTVGSLSALVSAVARGARGERKHARAVVGAASERVEAAYKRILTDVLQHPEVRRLERAWRGLRLLVENSDFRAGVEIDVVSVPPARVEAALEQLARDAVASERAPVDLVVVDAKVSASAADLDRLSAWADLAERLRAPLIVNGEPSVLGVNSLAEAAKSSRRRTVRDDPRSVAVRGFAAKDSARWVTMALNGALVRAPYTVSTSRVRDFAFEEDARDPESHVFIGPAFVVAALCAKSYARIGWPTQMAGPRDGQLGNLPVHEVSDRGQTAAIPLEALVSSEVQNELAREGFLVLASAANHDAAIVGKAPVMFRGTTAGARDDAPAEATLADQLFIGRFANAVEQLASALPAGTDPGAAADVARVTLMDLFAGAQPSGPEVHVKVDPQKNVLEVTVRPRRFAGISIEEVTLGAPLG